MKTTHRVLFMMEYIEGDDLRKVVKKTGPLPVPLACDYTLQAACGLQHAFERGFIHRDIKPGNLIVDQSGVIHILDFGLAKAIREHESATDVTLPGPLGTPDFMAPEQTLDAPRPTSAPTSIVWAARSTTCSAGLRRSGLLLCWS